MSDAWITKVRIEQRIEEGQIIDADKRVRSQAQEMFDEREVVDTNRMLPIVPSADARLSPTVQCFAAIDC
jgi:hypothetical protein